VRQAAETIAAAAAKEVREQTDVSMETKIVEGDAAEVLIDAAKDSDLLVIGSCHRSYSGLLTGSVSIQCALHATAPTTIVH
jgi:nucleotide-binding universal stress UspA family protein